MKSNVTLSCTVNANPTAESITWTKKTDGQKIEIRDSINTSSRYHGSNSENLTIHGVDESDSGEYICTASNVNGMGHSRPVTIKITEGNNLIIIFSKNV